MPPSITGSLLVASPADDDEDGGSCSGSGSDGDGGDGASVSVEINVYESPKRARRSGGNGGIGGGGGGEKTTLGLSPGLRLGLGVSPVPRRDNATYADWDVSAIDATIAGAAASPQLPPRRPSPIAQRSAVATRVVRVATETARQLASVALSAGAAEEAAEDPRAAAQLMHATVHERIATERSKLARVTKEVEERAAALQNAQDRLEANAEVLEQRRLAVASEAGAMAAEAELLSMLGSRQQQRGATEFHHSAAPWHAFAVATAEALEANLRAAGSEACSTASAATTQVAAVASTVTHTSAASAATTGSAASAATEAAAAALARSNVLRKLRADIAAAEVAKAKVMLDITSATHSMATLKTQHAAQEKQCRKMVDASRSLATQIVEQRDEVKGLQTQSNEVKRVQGQLKVERSKLERVERACAETLSRAHAAKQEVLDFGTQERAQFEEIHRFERERVELVEELERLKEARDETEVAFFDIETRATKASAAAQLHEEAAVQNAALLKLTLEEKEYLEDEVKLAVHALESARRLHGDFEAQSAARESAMHSSSAALVANRSAEEVGEKRLCIILEAIRAEQRKLRELRAAGVLMESTAAAQSELARAREDYKRLSAEHLRRSREITKMVRREADVMGRTMAAQARYDEIVISLKTIEQRSSGQMKREREALAVSNAQIASLQKEEWDLMAKASVAAQHAAEAEKESRAQAFELESLKRELARATLELETRNAESTAAVNTERVAAAALETIAECEATAREQLAQSAQQLEAARGRSATAMRSHAEKIASAEAQFTELAETHAAQIAESARKVAVMRHNDNATVEDTVQRCVEAEALKLRAEHNAKMREHERVHGALDDLKAEHTTKLAQLKSEAEALSATHATQLEGYERIRAASAAEASTLSQTESVLAKLREDVSVKRALQTNEAAVEAKLRAHVEEIDSYAAALAEASVVADANASALAALREQQERVAEAHTAEFAAFQEHKVQAGHTKRRLVEEMESARLLHAAAVEEYEAKHAQVVSSRLEDKDHAIELERLSLSRARDLAVQRVDAEEMLQAHIQCSADEISAIQEQKASLQEEVVRFAATVQQYEERHADAVWQTRTLQEQHDSVASKSALEMARTEAAIAREVAVRVAFRAAAAALASVQEQEMNTIRAEVEAARAHATNHAAAHEAETVAALREVKRSERLAIDLRAVHAESETRVARLDVQVELLSTELAAQSVGAIAKRNKQKIGVAERMRARGLITADDEESVRRRLAPRAELIAMLRCATSELEESIAAEHASTAAATSIIVSTEAAFAAEESALRSTCAQLADEMAEQTRLLDAALAEQAAERTSLAVRARLPVGLDAVTAARIADVAAKSPTKFAAAGGRAPRDDRSVSLTDAAHSDSDLVDVVNDVFAQVTATGDAVRVAALAAVEADAAATDTERDLNDAQVRVAGAAATGACVASLAARSSMAHARDAESILETVKRVNATHEVAAAVTLTNLASAVADAALSSAMEQNKEYEEHIARLTDEVAAAAAVAAERATASIVDGVPPPPAHEPRFVAGKRPGLVLRDVEPEEMKQIFAEMFAEGSADAKAKLVAKTPQRTAAAAPKTPVARLEEAESTLATLEGVTAEVVPGIVFDEAASSVAAELVDRDHERMQIFTDVFAEVSADLEVKVFAENQRLLALQTQFDRSLSDAMRVAVIAAMQASSAVEDAQRHIRGAHRRVVEAVNTGACVALLAARSSSARVQDVEDLVQTIVRLESSTPVAAPRDLGDLTAAAALADASSERAHESDSLVRVPIHAVHRTFAAMFADAPVDATAKLVRKAAQQRAAGAPGREATDIARTPTAAAVREDEAEPEITSSATDNLSPMVDAENAAAAREQQRLAHEEATKALETIARLESAVASAALDGDASSREFAMAQEALQNALAAAERNATGLIAAAHDRDAGDLEMRGKAPPPPPTLEGVATEVVCGEIVDETIGSVAAELVDVDREHLQIFTEVFAEVSADLEAKVYSENRRLLQLQAQLDRAIGDAVRVAALAAVVANAAAKDAERNCNMVRSVVVEVPAAVEIDNAALSTAIALNREYEERIALLTKKEETSHGDAALSTAMVVQNKEYEERIATLMGELAAAAALTAERATASIAVDRPPPSNPVPSLAAIEDLITSGRNDSAIIPTGGSSLFDVASSAADVSNTFSAADAAAAAAMVDVEAIMKRRVDETFMEREFAFQQKRSLERLRTEQTQRGEWREHFTPRKSPLPRQQHYPSDAATTPLSSTSALTPRSNAFRHHAHGEWQKPAMRSVTRAPPPPSLHAWSSPSPAAHRSTGILSPSPKNNNTRTRNRNRSSSSSSSSRVHIDRHGSVDVFRGAQDSAAARAHTHIDRYGAVVDLFEGIATPSLFESRVLEEEEEEEEGREERDDATERESLLLEGSLECSSDDLSERGYSSASMASECSPGPSASDDDYLSRGRRFAANDARDSAVFSSFDDARTRLRQQIDQVPMVWDEGEYLSSATTSSASASGGTSSSTD